MQSRAFTMPALNAVIALRRYLRSNPGVPAKEAAATLIALDVDNAGLDIDTGLELHATLIDNFDPASPKQALRTILAQLAEGHRPLWTKFAMQGRERVRVALNSHEDQCLRSAGLFESPPDADVVDWWDIIAQAARGDLNDRLLAQGRDAERLSLDHERARLKSLGISAEPKWVAIEDNSAGYDIHSYDFGPTEPVARLIEVKSTASGPPRLILSRPEWDRLEKFGARAVVHVWVMETKTLSEFTIAEVAAHIPADKGTGKWLHVEIVIEPHLQAT